MSLCYETELRKLLDKPSIAMFDLWHSFCHEIVGQTVQIIATNIKHLPEYNSVKGQNNTAKLSHLPNGQPVLCAFLYDFPKIKQIFLTHEIGHFVLHLQGFKQAGYTSDPMCQEQIQINSLCDHTVLYDLQRQLGQEPKEMIDWRARHSLRLVDKNKKHEEKDIINYSITIADDIINSSPNIAKLLKRKAKRFQPKIYNILNTILSIVNQHNLFNKSENLQCRCSIIRKLGLGNELIIKDDIKNFKNHVRKDILE